MICFVLVDVVNSSNSRVLLLPSYDSTSIYWRLRAGSRRVTQ